MTPRERLAALFEGSVVGEPLVCLHMWGRYPFELLDVPHLWDAGKAETFTQVYEEFWRRFPCDWLHVCEGRPWKRSPSRPPETVSKSAPLSFAEIDAWVDNNLDGQSCTEEEIIQSGMYDHVGGLARKLGSEVMIFPNQGAPGSGFPGLGWEDQLLLIQQKPELVRHYVRRDCQRFLARVKAAGRLGADGYIFSEGYGGVCDLISPGLFQRVFLEPKQEFYRQVRDMGMIGIGYFLGGIEPYLDAINEIGADGVLIEESKLDFVLDPVEIRRKLDPRTVLFGNIDSWLLHTGTHRTIRDEVRRQAEARKYGPFVFANGSPLCPGTPAGNITVFLEAARSC